MNKELENSLLKLKKDIDDELESKLGIKFSDKMFA